MIKMPVKCQDDHLSDTKMDWGIWAHSKMVARTYSEENALQIVTALNAQQPKCETCGGSGRVEKRKIEMYCIRCEEGRKVCEEHTKTCPRCKGSGIEPDCQPATETGEKFICALGTEKPTEFAKRMIAKYTSEERESKDEEGDWRDMLESCDHLNCQYARIEELEKERDNHKKALAIAVSYIDRPNKTLIGVLSDIERAALGEETK